MATVAAWILVLTIADPTRPQFVDFTSKENCDSARALVIERYVESKRKLYEVWPPGSPPVLPPGNPAELFATANAVCKPK